MNKTANDLKGLNINMWPFTTYLLTSIIVVPIAGKISDIYGRKPVMVQCNVAQAYAKISYF